MTLARIKELERYIQACSTRIENMQDEIECGISTIKDFRKQVMKQEKYKKELEKLKEENT